MIVVGNETLRSIAAADDAAPAAPATFLDFVAFTQIKKEWEDELGEDAAKQRRTVEDLRAEWNVDELMKVIQRVKRQVSIPVTTGETWDIWRDYPKLASSVDFIGAHILPYWDEVTAAEAVDHSLKLFYQLKDQHPGKRIVIAEFGWPSAGYNRGVAEPGRLEQATVLRQFVARADALGIDYNVIEAYDQPWKTFEGSVGRYWGIFDASRQRIFLDRADRQRRLLEDRRDRGRNRLPDLAAGARRRPRDHVARSRLAHRRFPRGRCLSSAH